MKISSPQFLKNGLLVCALIIGAASFSGCSGTANSKTVGITTGNSGPNIITSDKNGEWLQLSALKGSYVLVEFWESGNSAARMNHFEMDRLYRKYKNADFKDGKNFCVYSVSLDTDKAKWEAAITQDNVTWPCQTIDTKGWNAKSALDYGVNYLPKYYLLDGNGVVIKRNILIEDLESIIKEELN